MNILHISSANSWRGGEQQIVYLIDELQTIGHINILMHPIHAPIGNHNQIKNKCIAIPYRKVISVNPWVANKIENVVSKYNIDIIHAHDSHAHTFLYLSYILFRLDCPSVVSRRVDFTISKSSLNKYNYPKIKKIICVSDKINEIITGSLASSKRIITVHSGVDLNKFKQYCRLDLRKKYNIPKHHKIVANVSAIASHKDYPTFIATAAEVLKQRNDITFFIIGGDGGEQSMITNLINSYGLTNNIILTGYIPEAYLMISQLDIFLFPSKLEGLGTSILDAQATGVPVVSTIAGGIPELITHNHTGLLSKVGDSKNLAKNIILLLDNPDLNKRITREAQLNVSKYSKIITAQKTLGVYHSVI